MAKSKERSEAEHLKSVIRKLESEIRQLKKELKYASRDNQNYLELQSALKEEDIQMFKVKPISEGIKCPECGKPGLTCEKLGIRYLLKCSKCGLSKFSKTAVK